MGCDDESWGLSTACTSEAGTSSEEPPPSDWLVRLNCGPVDGSRGSAYCGGATPRQVDMDDIQELTERASKQPSCMVSASVPALAPLMMDCNLQTQ